MENHLELFDLCISLDEKSTVKTSQKMAMMYKLDCLHQIELNRWADKYKKFILLDSDILFMPDKKPSDLFNQQGSFVPYIHDEFDYVSQTSQKENANYWCDPMKAKAYFKLKNNLPQINASFIYFTREAKPVFDEALKIWNDEKFEFNKFRGSKTEEMCFNIAMSKLGVKPRSVPYRPVFLQAFTENQEESYIQHNYHALGLAGDIKHNLSIVNLYNRTAKYYRDYHGLKKEYVHIPTSLKPVKVKHISIPYKRRTLFRAGELPNSEGGIFNPDAVIHQGKYIEIYRKEASFDLYKGRYSKTTAMPHVVVDGEDFELKVIGWNNVRLEDFRLFGDADALFCNHTVAYYDKGEKLQGQQYDKIGVGISIINKGRLVKIEEPNILKQKLEKNWVMWIGRKNRYLLYSINPFILYYWNGRMELGKRVWEHIEVAQPKFKWCQDTFICSSTNPIVVDDYLLMFYHTKEKGFYYHGALLMNKRTFRIEHQMKYPIKIEARSDGMHKSIQYLSGCCLIGDTVRCFFGENDSHAYRVDFLKKDLIKAIKG